MNNQSNSITEFYDVVIVGAGPAGLGVGIILQKLGLDYVILEKDSIGASFKQWPKETRFISPSFTGNFFKMPDLNAITPDSSPAFDLLTEHPSGAEYTHYLEGVAKHFNLSIETHVEVKSIEDKRGSFILNTNNGTFGSLFVIWAAGEYQFPKTNSFIGEELCLHYAEINAFSEVQGNQHVVIGAYESGFDAAVNMVKLGKQVTLIDDFQYLEWVESDSSYSLSPFTRDRIRDVINDISYHMETKVEKVEYIGGQYIITTDDDKTFSSDGKPINCTGFDTSLTLVKDLFDFEGGYPLLNEFDESRKTKNLFLVGPQVKHGTALFCFIYKYRQRFAIVAEKIAKRITLSDQEIQSVLDDYKENNFYLSDLSCCDNECVC